MKPTSTEVLKFSFQKIDLSQIPHLLPQIHRSKYSELRAQIIEKVNSLDVNESFMFAPDNGTKVTDKLKSSIEYGVNVSLAKEQLNWRLKYSTVAKAFVVAPYKRYQLGRKPKRGPILPPAEENQTAGFTESSKIRMDKLIELIKKKFGVTLRQLQEKNPDGEVLDVRRAMLYVGRNGLGLKLSELGRLLELQSSSATVYCQEAQTKPSAKEKVLILTQEVNRN
jgi:hypothetical protein